MNSFTFSGTVSRDPETKYVKNNYAVTNFNIAVKRVFAKEGEPDVDFFMCQAFGKTAQAIDKYVKKGTKIICLGQVHNNYFESSGVKHYNIIITIDRWEFAETKKAAESEEQAPAKSGGDEFMAIPTDLEVDMPFA